MIIGFSTRREPKKWFIQFKDLPSGSNRHPEAAANNACTILPRHHGVYGEQIGRPEVDSAVMFEEVPLHEGHDVSMGNII